MSPSTRPTVAYVIGTRPEVIRSALVLRELKARDDVRCVIVHTGQHYDELMNDVFFRELDVPAADINLSVGSAAPGLQTAEVLRRSEQCFTELGADVVAVFGDTNSSLGAGIAATKCNIPLVHLEAGCREWEMSMPEEVNRRLLDHCSKVLLPVSQLCVENLEAERVAGDVMNLGDPLFDVFSAYRREADTTGAVEARGLSRGDYALLTLHRAHNVDDPVRLREIVDGLKALSGTPIVFPVHPRTRARLDALQLRPEELPEIRFVPPVGYGEILALATHARVVLTDSGGLQKEAFWSGAPCVTFRTHTAWAETVEAGRNILVAHDRARITEAITSVNSGVFTKTAIADVDNPYWQPDSTRRIADAIAQAAGRGWDA